MRRFESTPDVRLETPAGWRLEAWVAEAFMARLAGLSGLADLPPGRALLLPRCRSVHTVGMRFPIDVAFVSWPPALGWCAVLALRGWVPPFRLVAPSGLPPGGVAALEVAAGILAGQRVGAEVPKQVWIRTRNPIKRPGPG
jgi:uncharacterized membrane protein (UPF0127 family)